MCTHLRKVCIWILERGEEGSFSLLPSSFCSSFPNISLSFQPLTLPSLPLSSVPLSFLPIPSTPSLPKTSNQSNLIRETVAEFVGEETEKTQSLFLISIVLLRLTRFLDACIRPFGSKTFLSPSVGWMVDWSICNLLIFTSMLLSEHLSAFISTPKRSMQYIFIILRTRHHVLLFWNWSKQKVLRQWLIKGLLRLTLKTFLFEKPFQSL